MDKIHLMMNGLPGNVSGIITKHLINDSRFSLIPYSLTGPEITAESTTIENIEISLIQPDKRDSFIQKIKAEFPDFITIDFTHPTAVNDNAEFYVTSGLPFVMGTTGGDRDKLQETVLSGSTPAVIAPNMAKEIVGFQAMMEYAANTFPELFTGYELSIEESHQKGKADTSGTAKAMVTYFNKLGIPFTPDKILQVRDPEIQKNQWNIPEDHLSGHGWHTYTLKAPDGSAFFQFKHNINGRDIYAHGTINGALFLHKELKKGEITGRVFTMIDVLKG